MSAQPKHDFNLKEKEGVSGGRKSVKRFLDYLKGNLTKSLLTNWNLSVKLKQTDLPNQDKWSSWETLSFLDYCKLFLGY